MTEQNIEELPVEKVNDAEVVGVVAKEIWDRPISVLYSPKGARLSRDKWLARQAPFSDFFVSILSQHKVGPKDGPCVVLGHGAERSKKGMHYATMVGIDVDNGQDPASVEDVLLDLNLCGLIYTTHSHMRPYTDIEQDKVIRELSLDEGEPPTHEMLANYLINVKGIDGHVFKGRFKEPEFVQADKPLWRVFHNPLPKFRVFLPLAENFEFSHPTESHRSRLDRFADKLRGVGKLLGVDRIDESCTDPSRLFYLPSHSEGGAFSIVLTAGDLLDFDAVEEVKSHRKGLSAFKEMGRGLSTTGALQTPGGMSMNKWAASYAAGFEIGDLLRDHAPDRLRGPCSSHQGFHCECPFDEDHSDAGNPDDVGFMIVNGSEADHGGFVANCMHDSCQGRDRLDFLHKMLEDDWFDEKLITDEDYTAIIAESDAEYERKVEQAAKLTVKGDVKTAITNLNEGDTEQAENIMVAIAKLKISSIERMDMLKDMAKALKVPKAGMDKAYREVKEKQALEEADALSAQYEKRAEMGVIYIDKTSFDTQVRMAWTKLLKKQAGDPKIFWSDQGGIVRLFDNLGTKSIRPITSNDLMDAVAHSCHWKTLTMEGDQTVAPPDAVIRTMTASDNARNRLPLLKGIVTTPFFTESGDLVMEPGYNESGYYLADPDAGNYDPVPLEPSQGEIDSALEFIMDNLFVDFPFEDNTEGKSSRCHALAMLLQPFIRPLISGPTPIYFVDKPLPGTGATLLIDSVLRVSSGRPGEAQTLPANEEEFRKTITASLSEGASYFWLDNVDRTIDSESFASVVTSESFRSRRLGASTSILFPVRSQFIVCGNNVDMRSEMVRRMMLIHLDPKTATPTDRTGFKHPHLLRWVQENRQKLVHACLVLCQAWINEGCPETTHTKATYEGYSAVFGGLMDVIGVEGFMGNEQMLKEHADTESGPMDEFIFLWWDNFGSEPIGVGSGEGDDAEGLCAVLAEQEMPFVIANSESATRVRLGRKLKMLTNRQFVIKTDSECIEVRVETKKRAGRANEYRLEVVSKQTLDVES